jgi:putative ABC transport system permease protein
MMHTQRALNGAARAAWAAVKQNVWRSTVTLIICGIGAAGVILAGAIGNAQVLEMERRLNALGGRLIVVSPNKLPPYPGRPRQLDHFISLEPEDGLALREQVADVQAAIPVVTRNVILRLGQNASRVRLLGTSPDYARVRGFTAVRGRFLASADAHQKVIVLGDAVSREISPNGVRVGEMVLVGGHPYEVVGVLRPLGVNFAGEDEDHQAFVPLETFQWRIANRLWLSHLYLQLPPTADSTEAVRNVTALLRARHNRSREQVEDVVVKDMAESAAEQSSLSLTAIWVVSLVGSLLLVLGVAGIATLMIQIVRQRRAEIGLRRALGATPIDIACQLLMEGIGLSAVGILGGVALGIGGAFATRLIWNEFIALDTVLLALTVTASLAVSGLACLIPSLMAAQVEPAAALRL